MGERAGCATQMCPLLPPHLLPALPDFHTSRSGLTVGKKYELHQLTSLGTVPRSKDSRLSDAPAYSFTATAKTKRLSVSFASGKPAYFIATAA